MRAIHDNSDCPACRRKHVLYYEAENAPSAGRWFKLVCPATSFVVRYLGANADWKVIDLLPTGAVQLAEA